MPWDEAFAVCDEMRERNDRSRLLPGGLEVRYWGAFCGNCGSPGVFTVRDLALPAPEPPAGEEVSIRDDVRSVAQFCTHCREVGAGWHYRYFDAEYLPVLRRRVFAAGPDGMKDSGEACPRCGTGTLAFYDRWEDAETWYSLNFFVCPRPDCDWPGKVTADSGNFGYY